MSIEPARLSLGLVALLATAPFLLPEHHPPILSFYDEWLGVALGVGALLALAAGRWRAHDARIPEVSLWLAALAGWLAVQALLRPPAYAQLPLAGITYVTLAALLAWLGRALSERLGAEAVADALAYALLAGAAANGAIAAMQVYGVPEALAGLIGRGSGQVTGHVGQRNLLAGYLAWGMASLLYLDARGRLARATVWACGILLALAAAYSQSRSMIVFALWLAAAGWLFRTAGPAWRRLSSGAAMLGTATIAAMAALPELHALAGVEQGAYALHRLVEAEGARAETRPAVWLLSARLGLDSPWIGAGWGEFAGAAFAAGLPPVLAAQTPVWSSPHNLPLHVAAEAGIPAALLVVAAMARWWLKAWQALRAAPVLPLAWAAACVGVTCLHALLEYPLWYAHILLVVAFIAGNAAGRSVEVPGLRPMVLGVCAGMAALLLWSLRDYQRFDSAYLMATGHTLAPRAARAEAVETLRRAEAGPLGAYVAPWRFQWAGAEDAAAAAAAGERALRRAPEFRVIVRQASALERSGRDAEARELLRHSAATLKEGEAGLERAREQLR